MYERNEDQRSNYFRELALNLQYEGFTVSVEENDLLLVALEGQRFCQVTLIGGVRYRGKDVTDEHMSVALDRVADTARITSEYMSLFGTAPFLQVGSQEDQYRLLSDFNGTVLAGQLTEYGAQFITWERSPDRTSLNDGHYYGPGSGADGYTSAKRDFTVRSGLIPDSALFAGKQSEDLFRIP